VCWYYKQQQQPSTAIDESMNEDDSQVLEFHKESSKSAPLCDDGLTATLLNNLQTFVVYFSFSSTPVCNQICDTD